MFYIQINILPNKKIKFNKINIIFAYYLKYEVIKINKL